MTHSSMTGIDSMKENDTPPAVVMDDVVDDMHDGDIEREFARDAPALRAALDVVDEELLSHFDEHDKRAIRGQHNYRFGIFVTVLGGTLAVLGAILQLMFMRLGLHDPRHMAAKFEALALIMTALGLVAGHRLAQLENWLLDRYKAEELRLLKFRVLLDPRIWGGAAMRAEWRRKLVEQRNRILSITRASLPEESLHDPLYALPTSAECAGVGNEEMQHLLDYYRRARIDTQHRLYAEAERRGTPIFDRPELLPWVFFGSAVLVAIHVSIDQGMLRLPWVFENAGRWSWVSYIIVATALSLPVMWMGIRTWRTARASSRSAARATARRKMLEDARDMLETLRKSDAVHTLCQLQMLELVHETDQREWLRAALESEWYV